MTTSRRPRPVVLCILDGWGHRPGCRHNAICLGATPNLDRLYATSPHALIEASEGEVGLPAGQMGNSEVGHMNIGAGRVVKQDFPRIDQAIDSGAFRSLPALIGLIEALKASGGTAHLLSLLSPGGVHSHQRHLERFAGHLLDAGIPVAVHGFLDGRDTPPRSALGYVRAFQGALPEVAIATISGRYYAMDRDQRWDRVARAYAALVDGAGEAAPDAITAIEQSYGAGASDEFVRPTVIADHVGMRDGDGLLMINFRADRAREILQALLEPDFDGFARPRVARFAAAVGMVEYSKALSRRLSTLFEPQDLDHTLGAVVADHGLKQLRIAETEKYAHVTFFFNGGREELFAGEERILVPSPKVATYDLQPEMSAQQVTDHLVEAIGGGRFDLIVVNYANGDMVGHTGDLDAAMRAVEAVDGCIGRLDRACRAAGGCLLITADHGNAEQMDDPDSGQPHTAHTLNQVPILLAGGPPSIEALEDGRLADIAPTLLTLLGLAQPAEMTGRSLLQLAQVSCQAAAR